MRIKKKMKKKILIIEDDRELCEEMSEILTDEGYLVDTAYDRKEGEENISKNKYDISLLDLRIPGGGFNILTEVKKKIPALKVIVISASPIVKREKIKYATADERAKIRQLQHADAIFSKPFEIEKLLETIAQLAYTTPDTNVKRTVTVW